MSGTVEYQKPPESHPAETGPWVLLQAWPTPAIIPFPIAGDPLGRDHLARFTDNPDSEVSTTHCRIAITAEGIIVEDRHSTNGTYVDSERITRATIREGQVLRIGGTLLVPRRSPLREPAPPIDGGPGGTLVAPFGLTALRRAIDHLAAASPSASFSSNILITGETGTGKEALAHHVAARRGRATPFEPVNAAAYRSDSFDAAFFGHERGAFTGAIERREGIVGAANTGTLFLDELGDMPLAFQPLLLRFLETREVRRIGSPRPTRADLLVVAATHRDLESAVDDDTFREDLLARFHAHLHLPPLRARPEDIPSIARALATRDGWSLDPTTADVTAIERLMRLPHARNARSLRRLLHEAARAHTAASAGAPRTPGPLTADALPDPTPAAITAATIHAAFATHGSERAAARALGISRRQVKNALAGPHAAPPGPRASCTARRPGGTNGHSHA